MKRGETIYYFGPSASAYVNMEAYWDDFNERREQKGIGAWTLFCDNARKPWGERRAKLKHTLCRYMPKNVVTHAWVEIFPDAIAVGINYQKLMSVIINNKYVAETFKHFFDLLWQQGRE